MTDTLTAERLKELERLARSLPPARWYPRHTNLGWLVRREDGDDEAVAMVYSQRRATLEAADREASDTAKFIATANPATVLALIARIRELEKELDRAYEITGMGGYAGDAPAEMILVGHAVLGCDAWIDPQRVWMMGSGTNLDCYTDEDWTEPVRYVRAEPVTGAVSRAKAPVGGV